MVLQDFRHQAIQGAAAGGDGLKKVGAVHSLSEATADGIQLAFKPIDAVEKSFLLCRGVRHTHSLTYWGMVYRYLLARNRATMSSRPRWTLTIPIGKRSRTRG